MASPDLLICVDDFEKNALSILPKKVADYYKSGSHHEQTLRENKDAFKRLRFRPRCLAGVSKRDLSTHILGRRVSLPIGIAPTAMQKMAHPDGEAATAKASAKSTIMILSTLSTTSLEDVAKASNGGLLWFQLYIYNDRNITRDLVLRAEKAGYSAIVLTVDTPVFGQRWADARNRFAMPAHLRLANFNAEDIKSSVIAISDTTSNLNEYVDSLFDPGLTWKDIMWLKEITSLPIIAKGILSAEDTRLAIEHGVSGIIVSNHGARQLDGVTATIEALPEVVVAANGQCEVYFDGGIRTGTDVLKALALGAKMVFVGRPILWGLAHSGEVGVRRIMQILAKETDMSMALLGCCRVEDLNPSFVVREENYSKL